MHHLNGKRARTEESGKTALPQAKRREDTFYNLSSKAPVTMATDIVLSLLRYYQLKFKYLILLGKPIKGSVINVYMAEAMFVKDALMGKLLDTRNLGSTRLLKSGANVRDLYYEELTCQKAKTEIGKQKLSLSEELRIEKQAKSGPSPSTTYSSWWRSYISTTSTSYYLFYLGKPI